MKILKVKKQVTGLYEDVSGKVAVPILMYMLGVPGFLVLLLWFFFFRGN